jgi:hypothetical protein
LDDELKAEMNVVVEIARYLRALKVDSRRRVVDYLSLLVDTEVKG